eukprot:c8888_g1_i1 orf=209-358(+)
MEYFALLIWQLDNASIVIVHSILGRIPQKRSKNRMTKTRKSKETYEDIV